MKLAIESVEPYTTDPTRFARIACMVALFDTLKCTAIKARLIHHAAPALFSGTLQDHRPDLTCRQGDKRSTALILDVVGPFEVTADESAARWTLLESAAKLYDAELHFAVPAWSPDGSVETRLRARLGKLQINPKKVWTL